MKEIKQVVTHVNSNTQIPCTKQRIDLSRTQNANTGCRGSGFVYARCRILSALPHCAELRVPVPEFRMPGFGVRGSGLVTCDSALDTEFWMSSCETRNTSDGSYVIFPQPRHRTPDTNHRPRCR